MTQDLISLNFCGYIRFIGYFELISQYANIDSSHWLKKYVQWTNDKVFRQKLMVQMSSTLSSCTSLLNFWFLPGFVVVLIDIRLIVMLY